MHQLRKGLLNEESEDQFVDEVDYSAPLDIEQELLNHLTEFDSVRYLLRESFNPQFLNSPNNRAIYNFVSYYFTTNGTTPTSQVIQVEFPRVELEPPTTAIEWLAEKLRERHQRNRVQSVTRELAKLSDHPTEALHFLREQTLEIERTTLPTKTVWTPDDIEEFISEMKEKILQGQFKGHSFGFKEIDEFTGGNKPGYLAGLAARPKRQKTFFALQSFISNVFQGHIPILFTLENTQQEIILRLSCMLSGLSWDRAQRGDFMPKDWDIIRQAWADFKNIGPSYIMRPPPGERTIHDMFLQAEKLEADNVVISQFRYIEPTKEFYRNDHEKYAEIVLDLKLAATKSGSERPWYVETQLNREGESMTEMQDADLSQLGLTDMWGQACDIMFCIFQNRDLRASGLSEFGIIEARNSDKSSWLVQSEFKDTTSLRIVE